MDTSGKRLKRFFCVLAILAVLCASALTGLNLAYNHKAGQITANDETILKTSELATKIPEVKKFVIKEMQRANIRGLSLAIVHKGSTVYLAGFGYADVAKGKTASPNTLYQLASNSKAFTGLGLLLLEQQGKVKPDEPITTYIPWLDLRYQGKSVAPTVEQFLHHTSGIPSYTIANIPVDDKPGAIERAVRGLVGVELDWMPGTAYKYATINYDVLGLVIEQVSGKTYEQFISDEVLTPMGLTQTHMWRDYDESLLATGYKTGFGVPIAYEAPIYDGNKPAGYIVSNVADLAKWLNAQLGATKTSFDYSIIRASHIPNQTVGSLGDGLFYAAGWVTDKDQTTISHTGSNPNYSSNILFIPKEELGVALLCNTNSSIAQAAAQKILHMLSEEDVNAPEGIDLHGGIDVFSCIVLAIALMCCAVVGYKQFGFWIDIKSGRRACQVSPVRVILIVVICLATAWLCALSAKLPNLLLGGLDWAFLFVWYAVTVRVAVYSTLAALILTGLHLILTSLFPKVNSTVKQTVTKLR